MPRPTKGPRLGGSPSHERLILANLATALFEHRSITTTETKAKRLRPYAERLITKARRGDLHNRRQVQKVIRDKDVVHFLFAEIGPGFAEREGGYTRITKLGPRRGDNAPMANISLVEFGPVESKSKSTARKTAAPAAAAAPAAEEPANAEETEAEEIKAEETETVEAEATEVEATEASEAEGTEAEAKDEAEGSEQK